MQIQEFTSDRLFEATIRLHEATKTTTVRTEIHAQNAVDAKLKLTALYRKGSVLSFDITESNLKSQRGTQTLTADQLRLKSLADQKSLVAQNEKRERARQKMAKAQQAVQKANASKESSVGV